VPPVGRPRASKHPRKGASATDPLQRPVQAHPSMRICSPLPADRLGCTLVSGDSSMKRFIALSALSLCLTGAAALSVVCLFVGPAFGQHSASFAGRWTGYWQNSLGERGDDSLELKEDEDGNLRGMWSGNVRVSGRRTDDRTAELHGRTDTRAYRIFLTAHRDELTLKYVAQRLDSSGEYEGESRFTRSH
jgi:hypothetical protein